MWASHCDGRALQLSPADCVVLVDGALTTIGAGTSVAKRLDVDQEAGRSLGLIGWRGSSGLAKIVAGLRARHLSR
jgi:hypothetical protein